MARIPSLICVTMDFIQAILPKHSSHKADTISAKRVLKKRKSKPESKPITSTNGLGTLIKLPPELREVIYQLVLTPGKLGWTRRCWERSDIWFRDLDILYTSKAINSEATPCSFKERVCRINLCFASWWKNYFPNPDIIDNLQNITLQINNNRVEYPNAASDLACHSYLWRFNGQIPRNTCMITIEPDWFGEAEEYLDSNIMQYLKQFTSFKNLVLEFDRVYKERPSFVDPMPRGVLAYTVVKAHKIIKDVLEPTLGPAELGFGDEFWKYMVLRQMYYPRKYAATVVAMHAKTMEQTGASEERN